MPILESFKFVGPNFHYLTCALQELKQEVYSLRNKLATATSQEAWYNDEIAQLQTMRKQESEIQDALKEEVIRLQRKVINILFLCHVVKQFRCV